jgi:hypothetical protein
MNFPNMLHVQGVESKLKRLDMLVKDFGWIYGCPECGRRGPFRFTRPQDQEAGYRYELKRFGPEDSVNAMRIKCGQVKSDG